MSIVDHAILWQIYPLGAVGAPVRDADDGGGHQRLRRLENWLDYVVELGCSGILLGPIFASATHGYDTLDHFRIDARLGGDEDFDHLLAEAKRRGLSILLDGVFNHVGIGHRLVDTALSGGGGVLLAGDAPGRHPKAWEGHDDLAVLDHQDPAVADLVVDVMLYWLRRGIDGWRLDVAYAVPAGFWRETISRVRTEFPDALFLGEVIHGDYGAIARAGGLDAVTQYELWKAIWNSVKDRNFWELAWALERHGDLGGDVVAQTFVGNHDVTRVASQVGDDGAALAAVMLLTLPGMPSIYYGDEQAFRGQKGTGVDADDALRPPLPDGPRDLAPYGWWLYRLHQDLIGLRRRAPWIARGSVRVVDKDCSWISYRVTGDGRALTVEIALDPAPAARITLDGCEVLTWP